MCITCNDQQVEINKKNCSFAVSSRLMQQNQQLLACAPSGSRQGFLSGR